MIEFATHLLDAPDAPRPAGAWLEFLPVAPFAEALSSPPETKGSIAIAFVQEALGGLPPGSGIDARALLESVGIDPGALTQPGARVSSRQYGELWRHIARLTDDEFFGLDSHPMRAGSFALLSQTALGGHTLEQCLRRGLRVLRLILDDFQLSLTRDGELGRLMIHHRPAATPPPTGTTQRQAFAFGTLLIMVYGLACWLAGRRIPLLAARFRCPEPAYSGEWRVLFCPDLSFSARETALEFPAFCLDLINHRDEASLRDFLREAPANFLVKYKHGDTLLTRLRRRLRDQPPALWPDFATLARQMNLSESTLRRRLEAAGQSYRQVKDELRRDMAAAYLRHSRLPLTEIAAALGFAECSAFHRAFKKWTGLRPGEYRQQADLPGQPGPQVMPEHPDDQPQGHDHAEQAE